VTKKVLVIRHVAHEHLGALADLLQSRNLIPRFVNQFEGAAIPSLRGVAGLIVLGGPMSVNNIIRYPYLKQEIDLIRSAVAARRPVLGICLGSQLLAKALGASVFPSPLGMEIGWAPIRLLPAASTDRLFHPLRQQEVVFHWHGEIFGLPPDAIPLAESSHTAWQAFRHGDRAYGLLFHLEVDDALISEWLSEPSMRAEAERAHALKSIAEESPRNLPRLAELRSHVLGGFLDLLQEDYGPAR
jgi:GMP synthase (glutamine-hydrolysing)